MEESLKNDLNDAIKLFENRDYSRAQQAFESLIERGIENVQVYFLLANIFHIKGDLGKAIKAFNKVLAIEPNHTDAAISLSVLYNDIGRYDEAKVIFNKAQERVKIQGPVAQRTVEDSHVNKKFSSKHFELAELYFSYNRFDEALFEYQKATSLDVENLGIRVKIAKVFAKKGFLVKAFDELRRLKQEHPDYLAARIALGVLYYGNGQIVEAQNEWNKVLSKDPSNQEAAMYLNLSRDANETTLV